MKGKMIKVLTMLLITATVTVSAVGYKHNLTIKSKTVDNTADIEQVLNIENLNIDDASMMDNETNEVVAEVVSNDIKAEIKEQELDQKRTELENKIKSYLGDNINNIGLSYYDLTTGRKININSDNTFIAASTVKVGMNMVLFDMIASGEISPNEALQFTEDNYEEGTGILQDQDLSKPISIMELSEYSIKYSDNIATNMIISRIGYENMRNKIDSKLGHATDHSDNYMTPADEATLLNQLYTNLNKNPYYTNLIEVMKNTAFHDRLDLYLPHEIVAHKIGNYGSYTNDVGIIYTSNPYVLSVYTKNLPDAEETIAEISKMVYDYQNSIR